jgi:hypothetical protein
MARTQQRVECAIGQVADRISAALLGARALGKREQESLIERLIFC